MAEVLKVGSKEPIYVGEWKDNDRSKLENWTKKVVCEKFDKYDYGKACKAELSICLKDIKLRYWIGKGYSKNYYAVYACPCCEKINKVGKVPDSIWEYCWNNLRENATHDGFDDSAPSWGGD